MKSETLVACIKAVLWQQGYSVAQDPDPPHLSTINMGRGLVVLRETPPPLGDACW